MCSIAGYFNPRLTLPDYEALNATMAHRGPDFSQVKEYGFLDKKIYLAHNRLSIQDLSEEGNQPMESERYVIVFNGEIFNHKKIRTQLKRRDFTSTSDTQTVLYAFEEWGIERTIKKINGMFAIALFDKEENRLYLFRDRMGIKPLYYSFQKGEFAFASTPKGLPAHLRDRQNQKALIQLMSLTYIPSTNCYYEDVKKVNPGEFVTFDGADIKISKYWTIDSGKLDISYEESVERVEELLEKAVARRLLADVEVGCFLSGGVDSSLVTALAAKHSSKRIKTFSIGFNEKGYDESGYANKVANILGTDHRDFIFKAEDALSLLDDYREAYDEPFGDASALPMMLLSRETAKEVKVALSGDGGDELFLGYDRYFFTQNYFKKFNLIPKVVRQPLGEILKFTGKDRLDKISYPFKNPTPENVYSVISTAVKPWELNNIFAKDFIKEQEYSYLNLLEMDYELDKKKLIEGFGYVDLKRYLPDDILTKVDRASMYYSLEARVPLLDYKVARLANKLPLEHRQNKQILKTVLGKYIPEDLINRPKQGFSVPLKKWFRKELKDLLLDKIDSLDERFNKEHLRKMAKEHIEKKRNYEYVFWNLLWVK